MIRAEVVVPYLLEQTDDDGDDEGEQPQYRLQQHKPPMHEYWCYEQRSREVFRDSVSHWFTSMCTVLLS